MTSTVIVSPFNKGQARTKTLSKEQKIDYSNHVRVGDLITVVCLGAGG